MKRPQFSVRVMLLAMALVAVTAAWIGVEQASHRAMWKIHDDAVKARLARLTHVRRWQPPTRQPPRFRPAADSDPSDHGGAPPKK
jgi:hypothetical protein